MFLSLKLIVKHGIIILVVAVVTTRAFAQVAPTALCYANFRNDTLSMGNAKVKFWYAIQKGQLCLIGYQRDGKKAVLFASPQPDLVLTKKQPEARNWQFEQHVEKPANGEPEYLAASFSYQIGELKVKRVWRIYTNIPAIGSQYFFKGKAIGWFGRTEASTQNDLIENPALLNATGNGFLQAATLPLEAPHWQATVVKFTDATDHNNNLVEAQQMLPYVKPVYSKGNLLLLTNPLIQTGVFILKQAPLQDSQQGYPGFDFAIDKKQITVAGFGLSAQDVLPDQWRAGYSVVVGITDAAELSQLKALRQYQQQMRQLRADRDEMIISNTWGDRSQDSRMNEAFVLKELAACARLGVDHFQLDDGWQQGLSKNSSVKAGKRWNDWQAEDWQPNTTRFPSGFKNVVEHARALNIKLGLWFNPSSTNHYEMWQRDAKVLTDLYDQYGITIFKIDGLDLADKASEENVRKFFDHVVAYTKGKVVFNLDVTAGKRGGYFYFNEYGSVFLENRYTDWGNYYPHNTLRNLWQLSKYVPAERIQTEWLNSWRNASKYPAADPLAPANIPWDYQWATTLMAQPLAWMEVSNLPENAFSISRMLKSYKQIQHDLHSGVILPIGHEPNGYSWTGFQSLHERYGYFLVFRENSSQTRYAFKTWLNPGQKVLLKAILGKGQPKTAEVDNEGRIEFSLPTKFSFVLYRYQVKAK